MQQSRFRIIEMVARFFDEAAPLHSDTIQLVKWFEGQEHSAHADNAHPDGAPHNTPWRDYGSVVYLNDDYEGGEFFFQRSRLMIKPKKGMLLAFPGGHTHEHGVAKVRRGERYTMPGWYTRDSRHQDPSSLEVY
jgi:predicted 2-oxoglutarate/Fe(II)-dependent dioxygenase YbiX